MSPTVPTADRLERAKELIAQSRVSQHTQHPTTYYVSALDNRHAYVVQLTGPNACSCADAFYRRIHCKHYLAAALTHIGSVAAREEQAVKSTSANLRRAAPRPRRPIWYERQAVCEECRDSMPDTEPCPECDRKVCLRCSDPLNGVCLGCPIERGV